MTLATNLVTIVLLGVVFVALGASGRRLIAPFRLCHRSEFERTVLGLGLSLGVVSLVMTTAGFLWVLHPIVAWAVLLGGVAFGLPELKACLVSCRVVTAHWLDLRSVPGIYLAALMLALLLYGLAALAPPLEGDSLAGYLSVPAAFARGGGIHPLEYKWYDDLPLNVQMLSAFALLLGGDALAQLLVGFGMVLLCVAALLVFSQRWFSLTAWIVGAAVFVLSGEVSYAAAAAKIDLGWTYFELLLLFCFGAWLAERDDRWLLLGGLFGGLALGSKYTAVYSLTVLFVAMVVAHALRGRSADLSSGNWGVTEFARRAGLLFGPVLVLGAIWPVKNLVYTGSPVFPLFHEWINGERLIQSVRHADGVPGFVSIWWDMSVGYVAGTFGKPIGPAFLALLPGMLLIKDRSRPMLIVLGYVAAVSPLWFLGLQYPRNLLPALALLGLVCGAVFEALTRERALLRASLPVVLVVPMFVGLVDYGRVNLVSISRLTYDLGLENRETFLERHLGPLYPNMPMVRYINANLPPSARILALMNGTDYYVKPTFVQSNELHARAIHAATSESAVLEILGRLRLTHVYVNEYVLDLYRGGYGTHAPYQPTFLEQPDFQRRYMQQIFASGPQRLYRLCVRPAACRPAQDGETRGIDSDV
jgi:hypothetical protein